MRRLLFYSFLFYLLYRFIKKSLVGVSKEKTYQDYSNPKEEDMVHDPSCDTYISKVNAITATKGGKIYYFCSEECRRRFLKKV